MKAKIVINVPLHSEKDRSKVMTIAVAAAGVSSVSLGKEADRLEVIGEGVDSVCLTKALRKKFCFANIITVEEVKPPKPADPSPPQCCPAPPCQLPYYYAYSCPVYDSGPSNIWPFM